MHIPPRLEYTDKQNNELTQVHKSILALLYQGMGNPVAKEDLHLHKDSYYGYMFYRSSIELPDIPRLEVDTAMKDPKKGEIEVSINIKGVENNIHWNYNTIEYPSMNLNIYADGKIIMPYLLEEEKKTEPPTSIREQISKAVKHWIPFIKTMNSHSLWTHTVTEGYKAEGYKAKGYSLTIKCEPISGKFSAYTSRSFDIESTDPLSEKLNITYKFDERLETKYTEVVELGDFPKFFTDKLNRQLKFGTHYTSIEYRIDNILLSDDSPARAMDSHHVIEQ
jgi:hypothetical protein